jgi:transcription antitermination factor NusG
VAKIASQKERDVQDRCFIFSAKPQREASATAGLIARKFKALCPTIYKARPVVDRAGRHLKDEYGKKIWKKVQEPMFRGYGLVMFPVGEEAFEEARKVPGVSSFVRQINEKGEMAPAPLSAALVEAIQREENRQLSVFELAQRTGSDKLKIPFVQGGLARIDGGPYDDWVGKMVKLSKAGRVTLMLSMFGGETPVEIDGSQICAA